MKHLARLAATTLAATGLIAGATTTAGALDTIPEPDYTQYGEVTRDNIISPYGNTATCYAQKGSPGYPCYQQQPMRGEWVHLQTIGYGPLTYQVYPVWADLDALMDSLPQPVIDALGQAFLAVQPSYGPSN